LALVLIPLMIALYFFVVKWKKRTAAKIGDPSLVAELIKEYNARNFSLKFILVLIGYTASVIALANPRKPNGNSVV